MHITAGNPVTGVDFFDREKLIADLWDALEADSVLLAAPRRVGKSSIMLRLMEKPERGFRPLFLDGQNYGWWVRLAYQPQKAQHNAAGC